MTRQLASVAAIVLCLAVLSDRFEGSSHVVASALAAPYGRFSGSWFHHGGTLSIDRRGNGFHTFRTYVDCTQNRPTACDMIRNNTIYDGGFVSFTLSRAISNRAYGRIYNSSFSWLVGTRLTLSLRPGDTLVIATAAEETLTCGARARPGACGA
ncbi:MAG: hypothetical protein ACR2JC_16845 [Chloroflexota bacterium]|nr:MAG: hypothetical protein DLM70_19020 [Chloroflexota bacterium]